MNFLDANEEDTHAARLRPVLTTGAPVNPALVEEDLTLKKEKEHKERKDDLNREIELAKLNARLKQLKETSEAPKETSLREKLERSFVEHESHAIGAHELARAQKAKNAEKYKDDPELREMADEVVDNWLEKQF